MAVRRACRVLRGAYGRFVANDGVAMAGYIAFSGLLAIFPFLMFATSFTGLILGRQYSRQAIDALFRLAPPNIAETLEPALQEVLQGRGDGYVAVSILLAVWLASNAFESFRVAFDRAYGGEGTRGYFLRRGRAIGFVLVGAVVAVVLGVSVIFLPVLLRVASAWAHIRVSGATVVLGYGLGVVVFALFLVLMHRFLPSHRMKGLRLWPGVAATVVIWTSAASAFSYYLTLTPTYAITYGTLAGVIITLVFFYLSGVAVIFGAELNAELNAAPATETPFNKPDGRLI